MFALYLSACANDPAFTQTANVESKVSVASKEAVKKDLVNYSYEAQTKETNFQNNPYKVKGKVYHPKVNINYSEEGNASWYSSWFHGRKTSSGSRYDENKYTAAHRTLPIPSVVKVTNLENNKSVVVIVNDRGPFRKPTSSKALIDLSKKAAKDLDIIQQGLAKVRVELLPNETFTLSARLKDSERKKAELAYNKRLPKTVVR